MSQKGGLGKQTAALVLLAFGLLLGTAWAQNESALYTFCQQSQCPDGALPNAIAIDPAGNLYGTSVQGGDKNQGTIFEITPSGQETVLYRFCGTNCKDLSVPNSLVLHGGNLYGTTLAGNGTYGNGGTVFKLSPAGQLKTLYSFCAQPNCADGSYAQSLIFDHEGNAYGTAADGGANNSGTVFKITPEGGLTVLYSFCQHSGCADGAFPGLVVLDQEGNLYGVARGGIYNLDFCDYDSPGGCGVVFKLTPAGEETVLYTFCQQSNCADGSLPDGLILHNGNLFGVTYSGGTSGNRSASGTVFKLTPTGQLTVLHSFGVKSGDGIEPSGGLVFDQKGNLYGNALLGGANSARCPNGGCGAVFRLTPKNLETVPYSFCAQVDCADGALPEGNLIFDQKGNLYGSTQAGGDNSVVKKGAGLVFKLTP